MAVQEEPKEPHVSSVLPWVILHRIIWQEEDAFQSLCHQQQLQSPADEGGGKWAWVGWSLTYVSLASCLYPRALRPYPGAVSGLGAQLMRLFWSLRQGQRLPKGTHCAGGQESVGV